jgi:type IV pilus assembly protein PilA
MENPYSAAPAPGSMTPEQQQTADYELAIGRNVDYYLPKFQSYDSGGGQASWNWPAFFFTSPWYLYRKMWLWGLLNLFGPWFALMFVSVALAAMRASAAVSTVVVLAIFVLPWIGLTVFANALYWRRIRKVIDQVPRSLADKPDKRNRRIQREGGTGVGAMIGVMLGLFFFGGGILAAIAIPAYQDYTIRSQVQEGLNLAAAAKATVVEYYAQHESWPENNEAAGFNGSNGKYVGSVSVDNGSVVIVYGEGAHANVAGKTLILLPGVTEQEDVEWQCANGEKPDFTANSPGPYGTDLPAKYLPSKCRQAPGT